MITKEQYQLLSEEFLIDLAAIKSVAEVESSGSGFDKETGKIKIQFEPSYFKKLTNIVINNGVENQAKEWSSFNKAFALNPNKAMESTSIGCMQVMGIHWKRLGFSSVGDMWDFAKKSEMHQLWIGLKFIETDKFLIDAIRKKDWKRFAYRYNGKLFWVKKYDKKLSAAYVKYSNKIVF